MLGIWYKVMCYDSIYLETSKLPFKYFANIEGISVMAYPFCILLFLGLKHCLAKTRASYPLNDLQIVLGSWHS